MFSSCSDRKMKEVMAIIANAWITRMSCSREERFQCTSIAFLQALVPGCYRTLPWAQRVFRPKIAS